MADHNAYLNAAGLYLLNPAERTNLGGDSNGWLPTAAELTALSAL